MITVSVLIPTTGRAEQMRRHVTDLMTQALPDGVRLFAVIAVPIDDHDTVVAALQVPGRTIVTKRPSGTTAVEGWNQAYSAAPPADWYVLGADDICWRDGWLETALRVAETTGAQVIGLNDGGYTNLRDYAPHYMATRRFCEEHLEGNIAPPEYQSWWFDREVCQRARKLGVYAAAWAAMAEHLHPDWKTAQMDDTYRAARYMHDVDRALYERRQYES